MNICSHGQLLSAVLETIAPAKLQTLPSAAHRATYPASLAFLVQLRLTRIVRSFQSALQGLCSRGRTLVGDRMLFGKSVGSALQEQAGTVSSLSSPPASLGRNHPCSHHL